MYIIQSEVNGSYYIGSTNNIVHRLDQHNKGLSNYTKKYKPWKLRYKEEYKILAKAVNREYELKSLKSRKAIEKLINGPIV